MHFDKQPCSSALTPCASALTLTPCGMVGWTGTWLMALLEPPTTAPSPIPGLSPDWTCCWQSTDGLRGRLNGVSKHTNNHIQRRANRPTHIKTDPGTCVLRKIHGRGRAHTHTRTTRGSRKDLAMLHLLYLVGTMAYTNTTHSWSAPLRFRLLGGLFLRPPWNMEATERLALDNQLWRGWKIQFISPLFLGKQPLEQEMTVDVLIFKRWAPRSLRLDGRICSNVTELPTRLSSLLTTTAQTSSSLFFLFLNVQKIRCLPK